jgi:fatty-acyl-CoA synthase
MNSVARAVWWWARTCPERQAIVTDDDAVDYHGLQQWALATAGFLREEGVRRGDRVAIVGVSSLEWCVAAIAAFSMGAVVAPFNWRLTSSELRGLVDLCEPTIVLADAEFIDKVAALTNKELPFSTHDLREVVASRRTAPAQPVPTLETGLEMIDLDDPVAIVFTSGTTGNPKGVIFNSRTISSLEYEWRLAEEIGPHGLRVLGVLPMFTAAGVIYNLSRPMLSGGVLFLQPKLDPPRALEILRDEGITTLNGPPIIYEQIAAVPGFASAWLEHVTCAWVGGARVASELLTTWRARGVALRQMYGQTEIGGCATAMPADGALEHPEKCGFGGPFTSVRVVTPDGRDCAPGTPGEIIVRGPSVTPGYWRNEEATKAALRDGWWHSGDLGVLDEHGLLTFIDRIGDVINSGGLKISPAEVERVIAGLKGVVEVAVIGVPDAKFGQTPAVIVYTDGPVDAAAIVAHCNEHLADYKVPRYVIESEDLLPRMASGKIAKRDLARQFADAPERFPKVR